MEDKIANIKERVLKIAEYKGVSKEKFFDKIGMTYGNFKGKSKETPLNSNAVADILSIYNDINAEWLLTGNGPMLKPDPFIVNEPRQEYGSKPVPFYDVTATAGVVEIFSKAGTAVPLEFIQIPGLPRCDGAIRITGDSMYPLLKSGDMVLFKILNDKRNIIWGEMYLLYINNEGDEFFFVKYVHQSEQPGYIQLVSVNQHHKTVEFPIDSIKQIAFVKASVRLNAQI